MPRVKGKLSRTERGEYLQTARWLASAGAEIEIAEHALSEVSPLRIDQCGPEFYQKVFNLYQARVAVLVGVRFLAVREGVTISDHRTASSMFLSPWLWLDLETILIQSVP